MMALPFLLVVCYVTGFAFTQGFIQLLGIFPLVGCVLFFDKKFSLISGIAYAVMEVLVTTTKIVQHINLEGFCLKSDLCPGDLSGTFGIALLRYQHCGTV